MEGIAVRGTMFSVLDLEGLAGPHAAEFEGKKTFGVLFEEGCHAVTEGRYALSVNANSLHREAFDAWNQWILEKYTYVRQEGRVSKCEYNGRPVTEEMQEEFKERIEGARPLPIRTAPLPDSVLEEAGDYFSGSKEVFSHA